MRVVVTSSGNTLESSFDPRFGRAAFFIVFDTDTGAWECRDNNQTCRSLQRAGVKAAELALQIGVSAVLSGHVGPKARRVLFENNVMLYKPAAPSVQKAIDLFREGVLVALDAPDPQGAWK